MVPSLWCPPKRRGSPPSVPLLANAVTVSVTAFRFRICGGEAEERVLRMSAFRQRRRRRRGYKKKREQGEGERTAQIREREFSSPHPSRLLLPSFSSVRSPPSPWERDDPVDPSPPPPPAARQIYKQVRLPIAGLHSLLEVTARCGGGRERAGSRGVWADLGFAGARLVLRFHNAPVVLFLFFSGWLWWI